MVKNRMVISPYSSSMHNSVAMERAALKRLNALRSNRATGSISEAKTSASTKGQQKGNSCTAM